MAPNLGLSGDKTKKKKKVEGSFTWFETSVNGGTVILALLRDAASFAPLPYLRNAAATTLIIIQIAQTVKDNKADFRRLCEDAATLTVVVYESHQRTEDPDGWPGEGLKDAVDTFLRTLNMIGEFAQARVERTRVIRVMNSTGDGNKIREFRERLAQVLNRFEVSAHLQSYEILRLVKNMMEDYQNRLVGPVAASENSKEDVPSCPLRPVHFDPHSDENLEEQALQDNEMTKRLAGEDQRKAEREGSFRVTWFETSVNGGTVVIALLRDAASLAPLPYLRNAAATTLTIIQIAQTVKDNKADFRRLCEDAATLTAVVYESRQRSEDPDGWPGEGLKDAVDTFLRTLNMIGEFAQAQVKRTRAIRVMNSTGDGNKIREFRERLAQVLNRFEVSAHLQSYEILRLMKNMEEDYQNRLVEQVEASDSKEDVPSCPLPAVPSDTHSDEDLEEQVLQDEELAKRLAAEDQRKAESAAEQEARKKEQEGVNEKLQQILWMLENNPRHFASYTHIDNRVIIRHINSHNSATENMVDSYNDNSTATNIRQNASAQ